MFLSMGLMPAERTLTTTCPLPAIGKGALRFSSRTSLLPYCLICSAFISQQPFLRLTPM